MFEFGKKKKQQRQDAGLLDGIRNVGKIMTKGDPMPVLEIKAGCHVLHLRELTLEGNKLSDALINKAYGVATPPVQIVTDMDIKAGTKFYAYLADEQTGLTAMLTRVGNILQVRTNAYMLGTVLKSNLIQSAWAIKLEFRYILAFILGGVLAGGLGGLFLGGMGAIIIMLMLG
jgi:hypothetical protein